MNMIRKGQVRWLAKGDIVGQVGFVNRLFGSAAWCGSNQRFLLAQLICNRSRSVDSRFKDAERDR